MSWGGLAIAALFALNVAWSMGANDVANAMGTAIGSRVLSLGQALVLAGVLEFVGAVFFSQRVVQRLATDVTHAEQFADAPQTLALGMMAVLLASGVWIQIATLWGMPVSSTHAIVGAIAGFTAVAAGIEQVAWSALGQLALAWVLTPVLSGGVAALLYWGLRAGILTNASPWQAWQEWCPWLSGVVIAAFGTALIPELQGLTQGWSWPPQTVGLAVGAVGVGLLTWQGWRVPPSSAWQSSEVEVIEPCFGRFQIVSSSFVAFAHGANDAGNAIAPFVVILAIVTTGAVPLETFPVPLWLLVAGGITIIAGLAVQGRRVIMTVGEEITALVPSSGFCAELATAIAVMLAASLGFPVSTSHALVGSLLGISLINGTAAQSVGTLRSIVVAWALTVPIATVLGGVSYWGLAKLAVFLT